jgi:hypothetical protein
VASLPLSEPDELDEDESEESQEEETPPEDSLIEEEEPEGDDAEEPDMVEILKRIGTEASEETIESLDEEEPVDLPAPDRK